MWIDLLAENPGLTLALAVGLAVVIVFLVPRLLRRGYFALRAWRWSRRSRGR
jgi:hypothetical protein